MKALLMYFFCILSLFGAVEAQAHIFSYISNVKNISSSTNRVDVIYTYTISSWTSESDNQPNPCYNKSQKCYLYIDHRHEKDGTSGAIADNSPVVEINEAKTIGDVRNLWLKNASLPYTNTTEHSGTTVTDECVGLFYIEGQYPRRSVSFSKPIFPTSVCGIAPPPTGHCQFSNDVTIDYGTVSATELNGKQASGTVSVSCDADMNLEAWLINPLDGSNTVKLRDDGSISAKLTLDGEDASHAGKAFSVSEGGSVPLTITSEAIVSGTPESGEFSGSAVLFVAVP